MRKLLLCAAICAATMSVTVNAEPLAEFDTEGGLVAIQGYEVEETDTGSILYLIFDWTNKTEDTAAPSSELFFVALQNGKEIELDPGYDAPDNTDGFYGVQVMPGYTTTGYTGFALSDHTPVTVIIKDRYYQDCGDFTIDLDAPSDLPATEEIVDSPISDEPDAPSVAEIIQSLEQRIADLEERVAVLEAK